MAAPRRAVAWKPGFSWTDPCGPRTGRDALTRMRPPLALHALATRGRAYFSYRAGRVTASGLADLSTRRTGASATHTTLPSCDGSRCLLGVPRLY